MGASFTLRQGGCSFPAFRFHVFTEQGRRLAEDSLQGGATVRAVRRRVNTKRIVQRWNSRRRVGDDESRSSMGRGLLRLAHERRGLSGEWRTGLDDGAGDDRNLHKGRTGLEQFSVLSSQFSVDSERLTLNWSRGVGGFGVRK